MFQTTNQLSYTSPTIIKLPERIPLIIGFITNYPILIPHPLIILHSSWVYRSFCWWKVVTAARSPSTTCSAQPSLRHCFSFTGWPGEKNMWENHWFPRKSATNAGCSWIVRLGVGLVEPLVMWAILKPQKLGPKTLLWGMTICHYYSDVACIYGYGYVIVINWTFSIFLGVDTYIHICIYICIIECTTWWKISLDTFFWLLPTFDS